MAYLNTTGGLPAGYQPTPENVVVNDNDVVHHRGSYAANYHRVPTTAVILTFTARIWQVVAACLLTPVVMAGHLTVACIRISLLLPMPIIVTVMKTVQLCQKKESFDLGKRIVVVTKRNMKEIGLKIQQAVNIVEIYSHIIHKLKGEAEEV